MLTQIKLLTPVGMTAANTSPVIVNSSAWYSTFPNPKATSGMAMCRMNKQANRGSGFLSTFTKSLNPRLMLPAKVIKANSQGDR
ncbi:hypothetical protein D3C75_842710 [compost metagenome]